MTDVDPITARLLIQEAYEIAYDIHQHDNEEDYHPWALTQYNHKEDTSSFSRLYHIFYRYRIRDIHKRWGLSITEFLDLPRDIVELIFKITKEEDLEDQRAYQNVKKEIDEKDKPPKT